MQYFEARGAKQHEPAELACATGSLRVANQAVRVHRLLVFDYLQSYLTVRRRDEILGFDLPRRDVWT